MSYRSIYWQGDEARLKGFSSTSKAGGGSVVKIEIEVKHAYRLGAMLQDLDEIMRAQAAPERPAAPSPKPSSKSRRRAIANQPPLMLTYRKDDVL